MPKAYSDDNVLPTIPEPNSKEEEEALPEISDDAAPTRKEEEMFDVKPKRKRAKKKVVMEVKEQLDIDAELSKIKPSGRTKGQKDTFQRKKRYGGGKKMTQQALDNLAKARAKAAANRKRRKELLELKKKQEEEAKDSSNKSEISENIIKTPLKQVKPTPQTRRRPTTDEVESNFFNLMDKYYVKRDRVKAERKKKAQLEAKAHHQKRIKQTKPTPNIVKKKSHQFNNWDSLF
jgi:hypothetical protein